MYTTLLLVLLATSAIGMMIFLRKQSDKSASDELLDKVRARAAARAHERAFADTESIDDPYGTSLDLSLAVTEIDDRYDGRGDLTEEQMQIIGLIFDEVKQVETVDDIWDTRYNRS